MKRHALIVLFLFGVLACLICLSCVQGINPTIQMAKTGAEFASRSDPILRGVYEAQQTECLSRPEPQRDPCITKVRADWAPIRQALGQMRTAWCEFEPEKCQAQDLAHLNEKR